MRKMLFTLFVVLFSSNCFSQETFVRKYTSIIITRNDFHEQEKPNDLTVVFNPDRTKSIKFYYVDGRVKTFLQTSTVTEGKTVGGHEYQFLNVVDYSTGDAYGIQLFDSILRVIVNDKNYIEFYE